VKICLTKIYLVILVKICLIAPSILKIPPKYGGAIETFTYELGISLSKLKHQVIIISRNNITKKVGLNPNLTIYYLHIPNNSLIKGIIYNIKIVFKLLNLKYLDILHINATAVFPSVYFVSKLFGIPLIITEHISSPWIKSPYLNFYKRIKFPFELLLGKFAVGKSNKVVVSNEFMKIAIAALNIKLKLKFEIISQGINIGLFNLDVDKNCIRKKYNLIDEDKLILYVGRIIPEKNLEILINSFYKLKIKHTNIKLMLIGPKSPRYQTNIKSSINSKYYIKLRNWVQKKNLQNSIIFTGSIPYHKIPFYYAGSNLVVQPSRLETFGRAVFEAASIGIPFISLQIGESPPQYLPKSSGIFLRKMDSKNLFGAIETILNNEDEFKIKGIEEAKKVHAQYSWEKIAEHYVQIYKGLIRKKHIKNKVWKKK